MHQLAAFGGRQDQPNRAGLKVGRHVSAYHHSWARPLEMELPQWALRSLLPPVSCALSAWPQTFWIREEQGAKVVRCRQAQRRRKFTSKLLVVGRQGSQWRSLIAYRPRCLPAALWQPPSSFDLIPSRGAFNFANHLLLIAYSTHLQPTYHSVNMAPAQPELKKVCNPRTYSPMLHLRHLFTTLHAPACHYSPIFSTTLRKLADSLRMLVPRQEAIRST